VTGVAGTFADQFAMRASWRIGVDAGERTAVVTTGAFGWARNPIFTAVIATALGVTAMAPTVLGAAGCMVLVAGVEAQVRLVEEPHLRAAHGTAYRAYARSVGRFVPLVGRLG
jgi:protein-S-isoprenylcysteine O-methyltransferase Ste14